MCQIATECCRTALGVRQHGTRTSAISLLLEPEESNGGMSGSSMHVRAGRRRMYMQDCKECASVIAGC